jgi:hypothetical protein
MHSQCITSHNPVPSHPFLLIKVGLFGHALNFNLLQTKLAALVNNLFMLTYYFSNFHYNRFLIYLFAVLIKINKESGLCQIGDSYFLILQFSYLCGFCKLLIFYNSPSKVIQHGIEIVYGINVAKRLEGNLYFLRVVVFP